MKIRAYFNNFWDKGTAGFTICVILLIGIFFPVLFTMYTQALNDFNFSQNVLFPFISLSLIWIERKRFRKMSRQPFNFGLVLTAFAILLYVWAFTAGKHYTMRYTFFFSVIGMALWFYGPSMLKAAWAPIALFFLTIPLHPQIMSGIAPILTEWDRRTSIHAVVKLTNLIGVPTKSQGFNLVIPEGNLNVGITCSGLNYFISLLVITIIISYLSKGGFRNKAALLLFVLPIGVAANILRITANLLVAHYRGVSAGYAFFHEFSGILFAIVAIAGLLAAAKAVKLKFHVD